MCINGVSGGWVVLLSSAMLQMRCNTGVNALKPEECLRVSWGLVLNKRVTFLDHEAEPKYVKCQMEAGSGGQGV